MLRRLARIWKIPVWMFWDLCSNPVWYSANVVRAQRIAPLWSTPVDQWWMDHDRSLLWWLCNKRFTWKKNKVRWHLSCPDPWHPDILLATPQEECESAVDVAFLLDGSYSVAQLSWRCQKRGHLRKSAMKCIIGITKIEVENSPNENSPNIH